MSITDKIDASGISAEVRAAHEGGTCGGNCTLCKQHREHWERLREQNAALGRSASVEERLADLERRHIAVRDSVCARLAALEGTGARSSSPAHTSVTALLDLCREALVRLTALEDRTGGLEKRLEADPSVGAFAALVEREVAGINAKAQREDAIMASGRYGCPDDTDGDGNCPYHPRGCPRASQVVGLTDYIPSSDPTTASIERATADHRQQRVAITQLRAELKSTSTQLERARSERAAAIESARVSERDAIHHREARSTAEHELNLEREAHANTKLEMQAMRTEIERLQRLVIVSPTATPAQSTILEQVLLERQRQDRQWGGATHDDDHTVSDWCGYINEHACRAKKAARSNRGESRKQLIEVAALAVAALESFDRKQ